jgi:nucleoside-diphosphate-sugar epimerase
MRVIITGAAGRIGTQVVEELSESHELRLIDRLPVPGRESVVADLASVRPGFFRRRWHASSRAPWEKTLEGAEAVVHLAAEADPAAPPRRHRRDNIQATQNVLEAAARHGVRRVVFASSNWAVKALERELAPSCYASAGPKIGSDAAPRPANPYGASKAFGEQAGRTLVEEGKLGSFVAVRIGSYLAAPPRDEAQCRIWIGTRDLRSLLRRCVEAEFDGFHVVYGVSAQTDTPYDLSHTRRLLSWEPKQMR